MLPDLDLVKVVNDLLRTDPRLAAAVPLIGSIAVLVSEPKPQRVRKGRKKLAPPRLPAGVAVTGEGSTTVTLTGDMRSALEETAAALRGAAEGEEAGDDAQPAPAAPWLKIVRVKVVSDATRAREGDKCLVELVVDGGAFAKLRTEDQRRALALALRGLRAEVREKDGATVVKREPPPLQTWTDTADDLSHLVAALGVDGAEGAAAVSAAEGLAEKAESLNLPESEYTIKCPDTWYEMVTAAGLSPRAYLEYGEYAHVLLTVLPDGRIIGRLLRQDDGDNDDVAKMTDDERREEGDE